MDTEKKKTIFVLVFVMAIVLATLGAITFAFFTVRIEDEGDVNSLKGKAIFTDYKISLSEANTGLSLENTYPMPDEVGLKQSPYTFTVKNEEKSRGVGISVIIEVISTSTLSDNLVHVAIEDEVKSLSSENTETPSEATYKSAYKIYEFDLAPGSSKTYNLRAWINSSGTVDNAQNKTWNARVLVVPGISASGKTLEALKLTSKGVLTTGFDNPASTTADAGIYELADEGDMTSYYFRGPVENNYVRFGKWRDDEPDVYVGHNSGGIAAKDFADLSTCRANTSGYTNNCTLLQRAGKDMYWRIIRVNGDGSLRMVYAGTEAYVNGSQGDDTFIKRGQQFNALYDDAKYVGYMYSPVNVTTGTTTHSTASALANPNEASSDIKVALEEWYVNNLEANYGQYISKDAVFCYDRSVDKGASGWGADTGLGYGQNYTSYSSMNKFINASSGSVTIARTNITPTFICSQENDRFTNVEAKTGNRVLSKPIGLLTADEIVAAGSGKFATASDYYLKRALHYWTGSPHGYQGTADVSNVFSSGALGFITVNSDGMSIAPVINLTPEYAQTLVGDGTIGNYYRDPSASLS